MKSPAGWFALALVLLPARGLAEKSAVSFRPLTLEAACTAAQAEGKIVFVDFYTTWCGPCKMLDRDTWTDAKVGELINARAVALKLDAEKEGSAAARRYAVTAYPTLLLLKPDGTELDRIIGYREPAKFMTEFSAGAAGRNTLARAQDAVTAAPGNSADAVRARYDLAKTLARSGQPAEALEHYLWCYDEGMVKEARFVGVRNSFLTMDLGRLADTFPPAQAALRARRDAAKERMHGGDTRAASDLAALNSALHADVANLDLFDQLPAGDPRRRIFGSRVQTQLIAARRYADALEAITAAGIMRSADSTLSRVGPTEKNAALRQASVQICSRHVEVLAGGGDLAHARELIGKILAVDSSAETRSILRRAVERAGKPELLSALEANP